MKEKPNCQFGNGSCTNASTVKWGNHWFCDEHAGDRARSSRAPTTQPQAKGEFGEPWRAGNGIYKADGTPAKVEDCMARAIACVNLLAGHDLTKVAVVDKTVLEEVKSLLQRYERSMENCSANLDLPLQALAKLNAGGTE